MVAFEILDFTKSIRTKEYFEPTWMSATYAAREIEKIFTSQTDMESYYYKEAAVNARSPENEADDDERAFLDNLRADPESQTKVEIKYFNGTPFFVTMSRGVTLWKPACMRCHSTPEKAPGDMVKQYGPERSFHRNLGEIVTVSSVRIPLSKAYGSSERFTSHLSILLSSLLVVFALILYWANKLYLFDPLSKDLQDKEEALRKSEEDYRHLYDNAPDMFYSVDPATAAIIKCNQTAADTLGYTKKELVGRSVFDIYAPESAEYAEETLFPRFKKTGEISEEELVMKTKDGGTLDVALNVSAVRDREGNILHSNSICRDISERKRAEAALKSSQALLNASLEQNPLGIIIADVADAKVRVMNEAFQDIFGTTDEPSSDISLFDYEPSWKAFRPDGTVYGNMAESPLGRAVSGITVSNEEMRIVRKDGAARLVSCSATPIQNEQGDVVAALAIYDDITDRTRMMAQLQQAQKMESIGTLAGGIAHDFNNILSSILGFTALALEDVEKDTVIEDNLQEVYAAGKRAKELVQQILVFARRADEMIQPVEVGLIAKEVIRFIRSSIPSTIEIKQNIESKSMIMGSATGVHQILMNLCTNAAHAMEAEGGILEVGLKDVTIDGDFDRQDLNLEAGKYLEMTVSDTGVGIGPGTLGSVFDPYFTTKGPGKGTGMGLAVVHGIVETYGGAITVDSKLGQGTVFTIYLPATTKGKEHPAHEPEAFPSGTERILFVDDEASIAGMNTQFLERLGYSVASRTDSTEALELFSSKPNDFDLVITDLTMPKMTGDRLATALMETRPDIPVILCTGYGKKISDEQAREIGIKAFAYKPVDRKDLARTVRKVLDEAKK